jgi:hypothetical protein
MILYVVCSGKIMLDCILVKRVVENVNWLELFQKRILWLALC